MLPLPSVDQVFSSTTQTSNIIVGKFMPYGYMEMGLMIGALAIVFLIYLFRNALGHLLGITKTLKYDSTTSYGGILQTKHSMFEGLTSSLGNIFKKPVDSSIQHRDVKRSAQAIAEHKRFQKILNGKGISRYT